MKNIKVNAVYRGQHLKVRRTAMKRADRTIVTYQGLTNPWKKDRWWWWLWWCRQQTSISSLI